MRWGIIGAGFAARKFVEGLNNLKGVKVQGVFSRSYEKSKIFCSIYKIPNTYAKPEDLFQDSSVDAIFIATPNQTHKDFCIQSLSANKHVLCEKPFTLNVSEAKEVIALARRTGLFCMEAMWMRFIPLMRKVFSLIQENCIGEIRFIHAQLGHKVDVPQEHRLWNPALGGGALLDLGVYPLSLCVQLLGSPQDVKGYQDKINEVDKQTSAILYYKNGALANIACSLQCRMTNECIIVGTKGIFRIHAPLYCPSQLSFISTDTCDFKLTDNKNNFIDYIKNYFFPLKKEKIIKQMYQGNGYQYQAKEIVTCIANKKYESTIMPLKESLTVMEIIDAIKQLKLNL